MKATIDAKALAGAVSRVAPFAARGLSLPVLSMLRLAASDGAVSLLATDMAHWCRSTVAADTGEPGEVLVPAAVLARIAGQISGPAELSVSDGVLGIEGAGRSYTVRLGPLGEYPRFEWPATEPVPLGESWPLIATVAQTASTAADGGSKRGVHFEAGRIESTDGYRASWATGSDVGECLVDAGALARAAKALAGEVSMAVADRQALFTDGATTIVTQLLVDDFPRLSTLIPASTPHVLEVDVAEACDALAAAMAVSGADEGNSSEMVELHLTDGVLRFSRNVAELGSSSVEIEASGTWPDTGVALSAGYLAHALKATGAERASIGATTELQPVTVQGGSVDSLVMVIRRKGVR